MKKKSLLLSLACAMLVLLFGMTANAQSEDTLEPYSDIVNIGLHFILKNVRPYAAPCSEA